MTDQVRMKRRWNINAADKEKCKIEKEVSISNFRVCYVLFDRPRMKRQVNKMEIFSIYKSSNTLACINGAHIWNILSLAKQTFFFLVIVITYSSSSSVAELLQLTD